MRAFFLSSGVSVEACLPTPWPTPRGYNQLVTLRSSELERQPQSLLKHVANVRPTEQI